jgi:hypothetical protein
MLGLRLLRRLYRITGTGATALASAQSDADESALLRIDPGLVS